MGGEGSMAAANTSLKNNRSLLTKRKEMNVLSGSYSEIKLKAFPKATPEQLMKIRERIREENINTRKKQLLVFVFLILFLSLFFFNVIN